MKEAHLKVFNMLKDYASKGLLLDAAGGDGGFASKLKDVGYRAVSCDLYCPLPQSSGAAVYLFVQADMNLPLPFKTGIFDILTCMESLQYLENYKQLIREFARIIKKNGRLIIAMPNILNLSSRLYFLKTGYFKHFKPFRSMKEVREWEQVCLSPVSFVEIFQLLLENNFEVEMITASKYRYKELPLFLIWRFVYKLSSFFKTEKGKKGLLDFLFSKESLLGDHLIITARKL